MRVKSKKQDRLPGIIISVIMFVLELAFMVLLFYTKLISVKYIGIIAVVLLIMLLLIYVLVRKIRKTVETELPVPAVFLAKSGVRFIYFVAKFCGADSLYFVKISFGN